MGVLEGSRGSKLKLKEIWHEGCLFSAILVKEAVFEFKNIFFGPKWPHKTLPWGALKGFRGSKLKLKDMHMGCLFSTILVKEVVGN